MKIMKSMVYKIANSKYFDEMQSLTDKISNNSATTNLIRITSF